MSCRKYAVIIRHYRHVKKRLGKMKITQQHENSKSPAIRDVGGVIA